MFTLHSQLEKDTLFVTDLSLCRVLLANDSQFPWLILVPRRADCKEIYDLETDDIETLNQESLFVSKTLMKHFQGDKLNVATIGNMVPQLHIHHIVRFKNDVAWPAPVWGKQAAIPYQETEQQTQLQIIRALLT